MNTSVPLAPTRQSTAPMVEAAAGRMAWTEAFAALARATSARRITVETLAPAETGDGFMLVSPEFTSRWAKAFGDRPAAAGKAAGCRLTSDRARIAGEDLRLAIDTATGFYALRIEGSGALAHLDLLLDGVEKLGPAIAIEERIIAAQQDFALNLLNSGGTAAFVIDSSGVARRLNECGRLLIGECLPERRAAEPAPNVAALLQVDTARPAQAYLVAPSGRRLMTYLVPWSSNAFPVSDQRLLVAWDIRIDAPMTSYWGDKTMDAMAKAVRETFGLTRTESQLAVRLIGSDLRTAAAESGMAYETARSHLKSMFARMKVKSQSELMGLLSRFAYHERLRTSFGG